VWIVRDQQGRAVWTYAERADAQTHVDHSPPGYQVDYDQWLAQNLPPKKKPWQGEQERPL
jgi:hypothetical protein